MKKENVVDAGVCATKIMLIKFLKYLEIHNLGKRTTYFISINNKR